MKIISCQQHYITGKRNLQPVLCSWLRSRITLHMCSTETITMLKKSQTYTRYRVAQIQLGQIEGIFTFRMKGKKSCYWSLFKPNKQTLFFEFFIRNLKKKSKSKDCKKIRIYYSFLWPTVNGMSQSLCIQRMFKKLRQMFFSLLCVQIVSEEH